MLCFSKTSPSLSRVNIMKILYLLPFFLLAASATNPTVTITVAPPIPSEEPSYSKHYVFTSAVLNSTNTYRRQHNASALRWNATLATFARGYLAEARDKRDCEFAHSGGPYGENISIGYPNATAVVEGWGDERDEYDFGKPGFSHGTGHFTQLVWKNTTAVGCERVLCGTRGWFVACEYWPRGNVVGEYEDEVEREVDGEASPVRVCSMLMLICIMLVI